MRGSETGIDAKAEKGQRADCAACLMPTTLSVEMKCYWCSLPGRMMPAAADRGLLSFHLASGSGLGCECLSASARTACSTVTAPSQVALPRARLSEARSFLPGRQHPPSGKSDPWLNTIKRPAAAVP